MVEAAPSTSQPFNPSPRGQPKAQPGAERKADLGLRSAHHNKVADVAIVALRGRTHSQFFSNLSVVRVFGTNGSLN